MPRDFYWEIIRLDVLQIPDIAQAKKIAEHMINALAMGELGVTRVMDLLKEEDQKSADILVQYKDSLPQIVDLLCEKNNSW